MEACPVTQAVTHDTATVSIPRPAVGTRAHTDSCTRNQRQKTPDGAGISRVFLLGGFNFGLLHFALVLFAIISNLISFD